MYILLKFGFSLDKVAVWRSTAQTFLMYDINLGTFFDTDFPLKQLAFKKLPHQLTSSNYFSTGKFSLAVYFLKLSVIKNVRIDIYPNYL